MAPKSKKPPSSHPLSTAIHEAAAAPTKQRRKEHVAEAPDAVQKLPSVVPSLSFVPAEVLSDVFLCLPLRSMEALGTACGVSDDAGWGMLLGYSLRDMWTEAMIRDLIAAVTPYVRGMVKGYTNAITCRCHGDAHRG